jgi:hypothetical protein
MPTSRSRKKIAQVSESLVAKTLEPKPPQRALSVGVLDKAAVSITQIKVLTGGNKLAIPATWTEVIRDPQVWAELRPLLVDED